MAQVPDSAGQAIKVTLPPLGEYKAVPAPGERLRHVANDLSKAEWSLPGFRELSGRVGPAVSRKVMVW